MQEQDGKIRSPLRNPAFRRPGINKFLLEIRRAHPGWTSAQVHTEAKRRWHEQNGGVKQVVDGKFMKYESSGDQK